MDFTPGCAYIRALMKDCHHGTPECGLDGHGKKGSA